MSVVHRMQSTRPKYLNLLAIRLPLPGWVSILHRVSGAGMFLLLPVLLWLFDNSLHSRATFNNFLWYFSKPIVKLMLLGMIWAYFHHLFAGMRYLALDFHWGSELKSARASSALVIAASLIVTIVLGVKLW